MSIMTTVITGVTSEMQGVGRMDDGRAVFVSGALPGEKVTFEIIKDAGRFCTARLIEILEASSMRIEPDCPYYEKCGGCQLRHVTYEGALEMKRTRVMDALTRIAGLEDPAVKPTLGSVEQLRTRNKAEYPIINGHVGVHSGRGVIEIGDCLLQHPLSIVVLRAAAPRIAKSRIRSGWLVTRVTRAGDVMVILSCEERAPAWLASLAKLPGVRSVYHCALKKRPAHALDGTCRKIAGEDALTETLCGLKFNISPQTFFQVNTPQAERLYEIALDAAGISPTSRVLDAYCGCGTITLAAASRAAYALGVEIVPPAIDDAKRNAKANDMAHKADFICADAAKEIPARIGRGEKFDCVIVDPPRKGCDAALINALGAAKPPRISYVSCDPGTLARDIKLLAGQGYRLEWAQPVDMFPGTAHVETVALLRRIN